MTAAATKAVLTGNGATLHYTEERPSFEVEVGSHTVRTAGNNFPLAVLINYSGTEREVYARLFAAAPDLLAALQCAEAYAARIAAQQPTEHARMTRQRQAVKDLQVIRAAIAKATGAAS